jgi:hypothetical protein
MENVFPQVVFTPFGIPIRDTVISMWVMMALVVGAVLLARQRWPKQEVLHCTALLAG